MLVAGLLIGVPHGAVDHLLPLYRQRARIPMLPVLVVGYAGVAAVSWLAIVTFRTAGLVTFLVLSALHFGTGEATFARLRDGHRSIRWGWLVTGMAVVVLPISTHWSAVSPYLRAFTPGTGWALSGTTTTAVTVIVLVATAAVTVMHLRRVAYLQAAETVLLVALMTLAPPQVSLGVYFGGWHSVRHLAILLAENPANRRDLTRRRFGAPLRRFVLAASVPTAVALAATAIAWFGDARGDLHRFVAADLAILAALTVPHVMSVCWLDRTRTGHTVRAT